MKKQNPKNCWEYWNCDMEVREKCAAYTTDSGRECWMVAGSYNKQPTCPKAKNNTTNCWDCEWYKIVESEKTK